MNEQTAISTELAIPQASSLAVMFKAENGITPLLDELEAKVRAEANGLTVDTKKGRDALVSLAFKVSKSKAELDRQGKSLTEQQRAEVKAVNDSRNAASDRLDALRDEIRAPVTKWEQMEETRVQKLRDRLAAIDADRVESFYPADQIQGVYDEVAAIEIGADWAEYRETAEVKKAAAVSKLAAYLTAAKDREAQAAELEKLRADAAARAESDRKREELQAQRDAAEKAAAEKADQDRIAAERAEANRIAADKADAERAAQIERDKIAAAEAAKVDAEQRAAKEKADAESRHQKELADAKAREESAAQRERDRIAAEAKADAAARAKREADQAHRAKIKASIAAALSAMAGAATPDQIAEAMIEGRIPHCKVSM